LITELSIVIPFLNEEENISIIIKRISEVMERQFEKYEVICVDDGSKDNSWNMIVKECSKDMKIKGIKFSRNFGHHYAITAGIKYSIGNLIIVMDGDMQDKPEVIPSLLDEINKGFDIVFVSRRNRNDAGWYKLLQKLFYFILNTLSGLKFNSAQANFSIISRKVADSFLEISENARFYGSSIMWLGFKRSEVNADHGVRFSGRPSYTLKKRIKLALDIILTYSDRPLKFAIGLGILTSIISFASIIFSPMSLYGPGFANTNGFYSKVLFAAIFLTSGIILIFLGIIGTYIGRIFNEVKNRPLYIIDKLENL